MPPEVIKGQAYDFKADVWAVGVIVYELITLKKPFDCDNNEVAGLTELFEMIKSKDLDNLPAGTSPDLEVLIAVMLNKEPDARYSILQIVRLPFINKKIW